MLGASRASDTACRIHQGIDAFEHVNGTVEVQDLVGEYPTLDGPGRDADRQASPDELRNALLVDRVTTRDRAPRDRREDSLGRCGRVSARNASWIESRSLGVSPASNGRIAIGTKARLQ